MKKHHLALCGLALIPGLVTGCISLDEELVGVVTTQYFSTPAGLDAAVNGTYQQMQGYFGREQSMILGEFGTDLWSSGDQPAYRYYNTYAAGLNSSEQYIRFPWESFYRQINSANAVIERAPAITGMDPTIKATRIAEAKFLRAVAYFYLVQMYGDVHLTLSESQGIVTASHRTPADSIYRVVIQDLQEAIIDLPPTQANAGRATRGAARHLLAKVFLTRAYKPYKAAGTADFDSALAEAQAVIASGTYSLVANFGQLFCTNYATAPNAFCDVTGLNENNTENIYSVQFTTTSGQFTVNSGNYLHLVYQSFYDDRQGLVRDINNGRAFRRLRPTLYLTNLFQRWVGAPGTTAVLDARYEGSFQSLWRANYDFPANANAAKRNGYAPSACPAAVPNCTNGGIFNPGDTAMWQPGYAVAAGFRSTHPYWIIEPCPAEPCPPTSLLMQYDEFRYPTLKKFQDNARSSFNEQDGGKDYMLMRLGETYLIAAEAAIGLSNAALAATYINTVRERARNKAGSAVGALDITAGQATLAFLLDERGRELAGELHRWFDLARTGQWALLTARNPQATGFNINKHILRPIPQTQIDLSSTPFPQNPGY